MKVSTPLLLASLAANVALVAFVSIRASRPSALPTAPVSSARPDSSLPDPKTPEALRAALASGDLTALQAAGVPAETAREFALGRAVARFGGRVRAAKSATAADHRWWRNRPANHDSREQEMKVLGELSGLMHAHFGDDFGLGGANDSQLAFLPADKRAALRQVTQDYDEMIAHFGAGGVQLASDREKSSSSSPSANGTSPPCSRPPSSPTTRCAPPGAPPPCATGMATPSTRRTTFGNSTPCRRRSMKISHRGFLRPHHARANARAVRRPAPAAG